MSAVCTLALGVILPVFQMPIVLVLVLLSLDNEEPRNDCTDENIDEACRRSVKGQSPQPCD
jgi:hypothetical protein